MHDLGVVLGVGRGRHRLDQGVQVRGAADPGDLAAPGQLGGDRDRVGRLALGVEVEDRLVDGLVGGPVEVVALDDLDDIGDGVLGQQHAAEDGLFGVEVLGRDALEAGRAAVPAAALPAPLVLLVRPRPPRCGADGKRADGHRDRCRPRGRPKARECSPGHLLPSAPRTSPCHSFYGTALTNRTPDSASGASAVRRKGRATHHGRPVAPSANLVIHRPCGRRTRCCGELPRTCARTGGQTVDKLITTPPPQA